MGTVYSIRNNEDLSGVWSYKKPYQKPVEIDFFGYVYQLVFDIIDTGDETACYMKLYKFTGSAYAEITGFSTLVNDYVPEGGTAQGMSGSMVFNLDRTKLLLIYNKCTTQGAGYMSSLCYREWDVINGVWACDEVVLNSASDYSFYFPDITIDSQGNPHIIFTYLESSSYSKYRYGFRVSGNWFIMDFANATADATYHWCPIVCDLNDQIHIAIYGGTNLCKYYTCSAMQCPIYTWSISISYPVIIVDRIGDVHFLGVYSSTLRYGKLDVSAGTVTVTEISAADDFDVNARNYNLAWRWDYANNRPDIYAIYRDQSVPPAVVYKKYTTSWGSKTTIDATLTAPEFLQAYKREVSPPAVSNDLFIVAYEDNDGATPYPVEAWHSRAVEASAPTVGGYYALGMIKNSQIYGINVDNGGWEKISQSLPIIAQCTGIVTFASENEVTTNDAGDAVVFSTGVDIKEFNPILFTQNGEIPVCYLVKENIDFNDPDMMKNIESVVLTFESAGSFNFTIFNETGKAKSRTIASTDSGKDISLNLNGCRFRISITEISKNDFILYSVRLTASSTETGK